MRAWEANSEERRAALERYLLSLRYGASKAMIEVELEYWGTPKAIQRRLDRDIGWAMKVAKTVVAVHRWEDGPEARYFHVQRVAKR